MKRFPVFSDGLIFSGILTSVLLLTGFSSGHMSNAVSNAAPPTASPSPAFSAPAATSEVDNLNPVPAQQLANGLGFNVNNANNWELTLAKKAGATEVRFQPGWNGVENMSGNLALNAATEQSLSTMKSLGLQPLMVAAYGPPTKSLGTLSLASDANVGDMQIQLQPNSVLGSVKVLQDLVMTGQKSQLTGQGYFSYSGALIKSVDTQANTITLAAPVATHFPAGTSIIVNHQNYPPAGNTPNDPSVQAYVRYVQFLAQRIAAHGLTGRVEIWNEPKWTHDPWDGGIGCYFATLPAGMAPCHSPNMAFAQALLNVTPPSGVRFNWGGTHKTGFASVMGGVKGRIGVNVTQSQIEGSVSSESFHPYGATPEAHDWNPACLADLKTTNIYSQCTLNGEVQGSNIKWEALISDQHLASTGWTVERNVTETGYQTANQDAEMKFLLRTFINYQSLGMKRINFYRLADKPAGTPGFGVVDSVTQQPFPAYTALQSFMSDLALLPVAPLTEQTSTLPTVTNYQGSWPLEVVPILGRANSSQTTNSVFLALWQRTYIADASISAFEDIPTPTPASVEIQLPAGLHFTSAWSLNDRSAVANQSSGDASVVSVSIQDNSVLVRLDP